MGEIHEGPPARKSQEPGITDMFQLHPGEATEALKSRIKEKLAHNLEGTGNLTIETMLQDMFPRAEGGDLKEMEGLIRDIQEEAAKEKAAKEILPKKLTRKESRPTKEP